MSEPKKQSPNRVIELLVHAINQNDQADFYKCAESYRKELAFGGEAHTRLGRILNGRPRSMTLLDSLQGKIKGLVSQRVEEVENVFLSAASRSFLDPLLTEWNNRDLYTYHNLGVRTKLLLYGPSGNGKTTLARYLAREMQLPLVEVKADSIIDSHVGTTGRNINLVFENLKEPCILFWDEVDTIGRRRGNGGRNAGAEVENERMVNSMLLNLDRLDSSVLFVGATNRRDVLDSAFVRRFDAQFEVGGPDPEEKHSFAKQLAAFHQLPEGFMPANYAHLASYSDVRQAVVAGARAYIAGLIQEKEMEGYHQLLP